MHRQRWRVAALSGVALLAFGGCSASGSKATPAPTTAPAAARSLDLAKISATSSPALVDRNCEDFATTSDAQDFYIEAGGPDQDLHGLDLDHNGNACDETSPAPSAVVAGIAVTPAPAQAPVQAGPVTPQPTVGPPKEVHSSSGSVDGKSGGSDSHSSCESSDETRCD
jgi:hypothetical protein